MFSIQMASSMIVSTNVVVIFLLFQALNGFIAYKHVLPYKSNVNIFRFENSGIHSFFRSTVNPNYGIPLFGSRYVPPEMDPAYSDIVVRKRSNYQYNSTAPEDFMSYPAPKEGDIVRFEAKWGVKALGRVRFLRYVKDYNGFFADVVPLEKNSKVNPDGGGDVYVVDKKAQSYFVNVEELEPVKSFLVRKENGYRVYYSKKKQEEVGIEDSSDMKEVMNVVLKAPRYKKLDKSYSPRAKDIDYGKLESDLQDYEDLKSRIALSALQIGAAGTVAVGALLDLNLALTYALGVVSGCVYFYLLGANVESIGESYSALRNRPTDSSADTDSAEPAAAKGQGRKVVEKLSRGRLLVPVLLLVLLSGQNVLEGRTPVPFQLVPRSVYISAMAGFLTLKLSIFLNEVAQEFKGEDFLGLIPGSLSIVVRRMLFMKTESEELEAETIPIQRVLFITGPAAAGREELLSNVLDMPEVTATECFRPVPLLTTDVNYKADSESPRRWYKYVSPDDLAKLREEGKLIFEGIDRDGYGNSIQVALDIESVGPPDRELSATSRERSENSGSGSFSRKKANQDKKPDYAVLTGPPALLDAFARVEAAASTNIWISLQTKEQFIEQASGMVRSQLLADQKKSISRDANLAKTSAEKVSNMVNEAARDINFYMQKAPLFDFTILNIDGNSENNSDADKSRSYASDELRQIFLNLRS